MTGVLAEEKRPASSVAAKRTGPARTLSADGTAGYRADIDGLRALAILLVVVYHVWLGRVSGGVDVFLMISAFFLTASLARRAAGGGRLHLGRYWLRKFRRLVPAASVTLIGVLATAYFLFPATDWPRLWQETLASQFYYENWSLAFNEVDYYARDGAIASPLQHFWSLSVQGQVFVLWPLLIGLVTLLFLKRRHWIRPALVVVFAAVFAVSLWFSIVETQANQQFAYFDTRTRLWEFAAGSLVALVLPSVRLWPWLRASLGWIGLAGIIACGIVLDVQGGFPGYLALWPVLCTAFVIVSGEGAVRGSPVRLLSAKPLLFLGRDAYALYLIHWPVLITWIVVSGTGHPDLAAGAAIIGISLVLARILSALVESPLRRAKVLDRSWSLSAVVVLVCVGLVGATTWGWQAREQEKAAEIMASASAEGYPGAGQLDTPLDITDPDAPLIPVATELSAEWVAVGDTCTGRFLPADDLIAASCDQSPKALDADRTVLVIGDSHAQQLATPLERVADERGIGVVTLLKGGCTIGAEEEDRGVGGPACQDWLGAALAYAVDLAPDAVYVVTTRASAAEPERLLRGVETSLSTLLDADIPVLAVRDNPRFAFDMYECVAGAGGGEDCAVPIEDALGEDDPMTGLDERVIPIDYTPWLCPDGVCEGVIGNIALYIDDNHLSRVYGETLAPILARMLDRNGILPR